MRNDWRTKGWLIVLATALFIIGCSEKTSSLMDQKPAHAESVESTAAAKVPIAVFPEATYEFKSVMEGDDITHDFIIENHGQAPLIIEKVQPG